MKGIIVDTKGKYAVVLTGDGSFIKIHDKAHYKVGCEVEFDRPYGMDRSLFAKISSIAAVFLFTLGLSYGVYSYTTPYSYVDFDINPSIELTANIYDIIIRTETFNEDGEKLLQKNKLKFARLDAGIARLVDSAVEQGYLTAENENAVLLSVSSKDEAKKEKLEKHVEDAALKALDKSKVESAVISQQVSSQKHTAAKDMGVSPGKYALMEKAMEVEPGLDIESLKDKPVKEIMGIINGSREDGKQEEKQDKNTGKQDDKEGQKQDKEVKETQGKKQDKEVEGTQGNKQDKEVEGTQGKKQDKEVENTQGKKQSNEAEETSIKKPEDKNDKIEETQKKKPDDNGNPDKAAVIPTSQVTEEQDEGPGSGNKDAASNSSGKNGKDEKADTGNKGSNGEKPKEKQ